MYEEFFGLSRPPFKITPDTSLFYDGGRRGDVLGALVYAVQRGEGIVKVVGEVGSGKTMLCRMLQQELPESVEIIYIANPSVSPDDILFVIAHELSLDVQKDSSKHEVMHLLQTHLLSRYTGNRQVVLFVEEAQGMPLDTLEEIRLLSNLETDQDKLLQIILFGQPELDENLKISSIRQLKERVTHEFNLTPLTDKEIHQYLNFRMREVGYTGPELVDERVAKIISKYSGGLLRRINIIADKVLLSAFAESTHNITVKHVNAAVKDSGFERSIDGVLTRDSRWVLITVIMLFILLSWLFASGKGQVLINLVKKNTQDQEAVVQKKLDISEKNEQLKTVVTLPTKKQVDPEDQKHKKMVKIEKPISLLKVESSGALIEKKTEPEKKKDDRLALIISRKKKNSGVDKDITPEESLNKYEITQNSASKLEEKTKINDDAVIYAIKNSLKNETNLENKEWLAWKLEESKAWLIAQSNKGVSIQVMMRSKTASNELVNALRKQWPLDVKKTYLYEVKMNGNSIYRVFYGGFSSLSTGQKELKELPEEVKSNGPYLHSIYKMKKTLL